MVNVESKRFVGGVHIVPLSRKNAGKVEWVFSKKEAINPFSLRALTGAKSQLYMELSAICRKKGTKTTGALALSKGDIKELSCGHACLPLDEALKAGKNKMSVQLFGGVPWSKNSIRKEDVKKGKVRSCLPSSFFLSLSLSFFLFLSLSIYLSILISLSLSLPLSPSDWPILTHQSFGRDSLQV